MKPILFVDDEVQYLSLMEEYFHQTGEDILTAKDGPSALLLVKEHCPGTVFLDVMMPQMDGEETFRLIREIDPEIRVVIVSGNASEDLARKLLQSGAFDFLEKPVA